MRGFLCAVVLTSVGCLTAPQDQIMTRPTEFPDWATNANFSTGPLVGQPTKLAPSVGRRADGWRPNNIPPAQEENYDRNLLTQWLNWFDNGADASLVALAASTGASPGTKRFVQNLGWYMYAVVAPAAPDAFWIVDATPGMGAGAWIHELWAAHTLKHMPSIGPVTGESFTAATPAGRVNPDVVPHGHLRHALATHTQYLATSASSATLFTVDLGTLAVNDIIDVRVNAVAGSNAAAASNFSVWMEVSQNGGGAWTNVTPHGSSYRTDPNNTAQSLAVNFTSLVVNNADCQFRMRVASDGVNQIYVDVDSYLAWVYRP